MDNLNVGNLLRLSKDHVQVFPGVELKHVVHVQLFMDHVQVFPDGGLNLLCLCSCPSNIFKSSQHKALNIQCCHNCQSSIQKSPQHKTLMQCVLLLQLSMDHVQVFPDGELNVQAAASRDTSPSFVRPISKAAQHRPRNIVDVPKLQRCFSVLVASRCWLTVFCPLDWLVGAFL